MKIKWHLPKWTVDYPDAGPIRRTINLLEMDHASLRSFSAYVAICVAPLAQGDEKRKNYVMRLLDACWAAQKLSTLEKLALVA